MMDFIERLFGIAPDGGSGALELLLLMTPILGLLVSVACRELVQRQRGLVHRAGKTDGTYANSGR
jgi:hypothetical protein